MTAMADGRVTCGLMQYCRKLSANSQLPKTWGLGKRAWGLGKRAPFTGSPLAAPSTAVISALPDVDLSPLPLNVSPVPPGLSRVAHSKITYVSHCCRPHITLTSALTLFQSLTMSRPSVVSWVSVGYD